MPDTWNIVEWAVEQIADSGHFNVDDELEIHAHVTEDSGSYIRVFVTLDKDEKGKLIIRYEPKGINVPVNLKAPLAEITYLFKRNDILLSDVISALTLAHKLCRG